MGTEVHRERPIQWAEPYRVPIPEKWIILSSTLLLHSYFRTGGEEWRKGRWILSNTWTHPERHLRLLGSNCWCQTGWSEHLRNCWFPGIFTHILWGLQRMLWKTKKHPVSSGSVDINVLLMREVRQEHLTKPHITTEHAMRQTYKSVVSNHVPWRAESMQVFTPTNHYTSWFY